MTTSKNTNPVFNYIKIKKKDDGTIFWIINKYLNSTIGLNNMAEGIDGCPTTIQFNAESGEFKFISYWTPPISMYREMAQEINGVEFYFEYQEPKAGLCGHGTASAGLLRNTSYLYNNSDEYETLKSVHRWTYPLWDELYEGEMHLPLNPLRS